MMDNIYIYLMNCQRLQGGPPKEQIKEKETSSSQQSVLASAALKQNPTLPQQPDNKQKQPIQKQENQQNRKQEGQQLLKKPLQRIFQVKMSESGRKIFTFSMFPNDPFVLDPQYEVESLKGWGTYGKVAEGRNILSSEKLAIKRIHPVFNNLGDTKRILRQIKIQKFLKHKNIMTLKEILAVQNQQNFNEIYITMQFMQYTLKSVIHNNQFKITQKMIQFIMYQLLSATYYMHSADIIHRDLKPDNILVNKKLQLKVTDMNLARKEIPTDEPTYYVTSRPYRAPQIFINSNAYTKAIDMWSIGCILAEMLGKTILFQGRDYIDQIKRFVAILGKPTLEVFPNIDDITAQGLAKVLRDIPSRQKVDWKFLYPNASQDALDLLNKLLVYDANTRYTAEQCLNHIFLKDFRARPKVKCNDVFDFTFDKIEMTPQKLRMAILQETNKNTDNQEVECLIPVKKVKVQ